MAMAVLPDPTSPCTSRPSRPRRPCRGRSHPSPAPGRRWGGKEGGPERPDLLWRTGDGHTFAALPAQKPEPHLIDQQFFKRQARRATASASMLSGKCAARIAKLRRTVRGACEGLGKLVGPLPLVLPDAWATISGRPRRDAGRLPVYGHDPPLPLDGRAGQLQRAALFHAAVSSTSRPTGSDLASHGWLYHTARTEPLASDTFALTIARRPLRKARGVRSTPTPRSLSLGELIDGDDAGQIRYSAAGAAKLADGFDAVRLKCLEPRGTDARSGEIDVHYSPRSVVVERLPPGRPKRRRNRTSPPAGRAARRPPPWGYPRRSRW